MVSQVQVHANPKEAWELICTLESEVAEHVATISRLRAELAAIQAAYDKATGGGQTTLVDGFDQMAATISRLRAELAAIQAASRRRHPMSEKLSEKGTTMIIEASAHIPGAWVAERIDEDGGIEQAVFIGPRAKERALAYPGLANGQERAEGVSVSSVETLEAVEREREACVKLAESHKTECD